jgi:hypothetical protein
MIVDASIMNKPTTPFGIAINAGCFAAFTIDGACTCQDPCMLHAAAGVQAAQAGSFVLEKCSKNANTTHCCLFIYHNRQLQGCTAQQLPC